MNKNYSIGVMQGRLLPKYQGRYQAHPVGMWQEEFNIAQKLNVDAIEFILDFNDAEINPLMTKDGLKQIKDLVAKTGVVVKSVCADYFMHALLHSVSIEEIEASKAVLTALIANCSEIGINDIVIPLVDQSSMHTIESKKEFIENMRSIIPLAEHYSMNLALETDLSPHDFANLLKNLDSPRITVNYDSGNSASLGYDVRQEFAAYGARVSSIHIKDRLRGGGSVTLGSGNTDFDAFFECVNSLDYKGIFIMQAYRDDEGVSIFKQQFEWVKSKLDAYHEKRSSCYGYSSHTC